MTTTDLEWARGVARRIRLIEPPAAKAIEQLGDRLEQIRDWAEKTSEMGTAKTADSYEQAFGDAASEVLDILGDTP